MDSKQIAALVEPFLAPVAAESTPEDRPRANFSSEASRALTETQLQQISAYLDLLLRWNARMNLSAVRDAEGMVTRHFGESLFTARHLFPSKPDRLPMTRLIDLGSGAGFPGLPIKIWSSGVELTLIEANQKKATFLREVVRRLELNDVTVFSGRAENFPDQADVVTLRAVERFETALGVASQLVVPAGRVALLLGSAQVMRAKELARVMTWQRAAPIPLSSSRVLLIGRKHSLETSR
jgi:16S rRNA (guanine527-N7)-methyltransferase